jgi:hypothetical protein
MRLLVALVLLILFPAVTAADDKAEFRWVLGLGSGTSCGQYVAATNGHNVGTHTELQRSGVTFVSQNDAMIQYVYGVLTGVNWARDSQHQIQTDSAALDLWLRNWCNKRPTKGLQDAIVTFVGETPGTPLK